MATSEFDPIALARAEAIDTAHEPEDVGEFVTSEAHDDGVTDFRFEALMKGYEGWQWSVTLYHDVELDHWTIDESSLIPTDKALLPPKWVPWKDRLLPSDLSVTDSIGTPEDDERLDDGIGIDEAVSRTEELNAEQQAVETVQAQEGGSPDEQADALTAVEDVVEAVEELDLSRRHVLSELGQTQTAQRWYEGPHGPKSLSTKTADGNLCSTCGFFIPLAGSLKTMFGVCANRWSPDDGKVVSVDHGCGEHSEIRPPMTICISMWWPSMGVTSARTRNCSKAWMRLMRNLWQGSNRRHSIWTTTCPIPARSVSGQCRRRIFPVRNRKRILLWSGPLPKRFARTRTQSRLTRCAPVSR